MWLARIRRLFMLTVLGAFLFAGLGEHAMTADAVPAVGTAAMSMAMDMDGGGTVPMPCCKGKTPNCYSSMGCIFMVALPPAYSPTATQLVWSRVVYPSAASWHSGLSLEPDLGPPIHA